MFVHWRLDESVLPLQNVASSTLLSLFAESTGGIWLGGQNIKFQEVRLTHSIHGTGIFTYMNGGFLW